MYCWIRAQIRTRRQNAPPAQGNTGPFLSWVRTARLPLLRTGTTFPVCFASDSRRGGPFKQQNSCCNRRLEDWSFPRGGAYACCSDQRKRGFFRGKSEFRGTHFGAKKKRRTTRKKRQRKAWLLRSQARRSRCNRPSSRVRAHRGHPSDPSPEQARPQDRGAAQGLCQPWGGAAPGCARSRWAISKRGSPSAAWFGRGPGGECPALPRRHSLVASPGLRAMPRAV